jgi:gamma-tubulin complex component 3
LRRLIVWLAEPKIRMRGLAGIADAAAHLEGGALINAVDALAQHGDSLVQQFISRTLQQMCQPLFQMAREWVFDGRLNNAGTEFFVVSTGVGFSIKLLQGRHTHIPWHSMLGVI